MKAEDINQAKEMHKNLFEALIRFKVEYLMEKQNLKTRTLLDEELDKLFTENIGISRVDDLKKHINKTPNIFDSPNFRFLG